MHHSVSVVMGTNAAQSTPGCVLAVHSMFTEQLLILTVLDHFKPSLSAILRQMKILLHEVRMHHSVSVVMGTNAAQSTPGCGLTPRNMLIEQLWFATVLDHFIRSFSGHCSPNAGFAAQGENASQCKCCNGNQCCAKHSRVRANVK